MFLSDLAIKNLCTNSLHHQVIYTEVMDDVTNDPDYGAAVYERPLFYIHLDKPMIEPFIDSFQNESNEGHRLPSYGLSSFGYDVRLSDDIKIFSNVHGGIVDPLEHSDDNFIKAVIKKNSKGLRYFTLPPNSYALGVTREYFTMPTNVIGICLGKSTYARCGIEINTTVIEAGWEGQIVIEIGNGSSLPVKIYVDGGISQINFGLGTEECLNSYAVGNRKYQGQTGLTFAKG